MRDLLADGLCALLLATIGAILAHRLLPRLKHVSSGVLFGAIFTVVVIAGVFFTPLGAPVFDAAALILAAFVAMGGVLAVAARRGAAPSVVQPTDDEPAPDERRWAAVGVAFSFAWFALLLLVLVGIRWFVQDVPQD